MTTFLLFVVVGAAVELCVTVHRARRERRARVERNRQAARDLQARGYDVTPPYLIRSERDPVLPDTPWNRALRELNRR